MTTSSAVSNHGHRHGFAKPAPTGYREPPARHPAPAKVTFAGAGGVEAAWTGGGADGRTVRPAGGAGDRRRCGGAQWRRTVDGVGDSGLPGAQRGDSAAHADDVPDLHRRSGGAAPLLGPEPSRLADGGPGGPERRPPGDRRPRAARAAGRRADPERGRSAPGGWRPVGHRAARQPRQGGLPGLWPVQFPGGAGPAAADRESRVRRPDRQDQSGRRRRPSGRGDRRVPAGGLPVVRPGPG